MYKLAYLLLLVGATLGKRLCNNKGMMHLASFTLSLALGLSYGAQIQTIKGEEALFDTTLRSGSISCPTTSSDYDGNHYCRCPPGKSMSYIKSEHDNGKEDRNWLVKCQAIPGGGFSTDDVNVTAFSLWKSHQIFDTQAVPLYQRLNHKGDCWDECNLNGRGQGPCDWCGLEGLCCRKGSNWIGNGCDGAIGEWDHHKCVSKPVPGLKNGREHCWNGCNEKQGKCNFCGSNGYCCRKGYKGNGCDGKIGGNDHHICVTYPVLSLENMGEICWDPCDEKQGACEFCGLDGVCCRKGYTGNGCDGEIGGDDHHRCASKPEKTNGFIVGMESHHSNDKEDRRFRFFWQESPNHSLEDCSWTYKLNEWDGKIDYTLPAGKVIAGVESTFDDHKNDRKFYLKTCTLAKKCAEIGKQPVYDWDKKTMEYDPAGEVISTNSLDNLKHNLPGEFTVEISKTSSKTLANSYSYSYLSGHEMTFSLDVTAGVSWGLGPIAEASVEIAAGFSSTWKTEEQWTRENSQEITAENGYKTTWKTACAAHALCQANIIMQTGVAKVPYTLVSHTVGNEDEKCTEEGILTIKRSWDARMTITSYKKCPCTPGQGDVGCSSDGMCSCLTSADQCRDDGKCSSYTCKEDED